MIIYDLYSNPDVKSARFSSVSRPLGVLDVLKEQGLGAKGKEVSEQDNQFFKILKVIEIGCCIFYIFSLLNYTLLNKFRLQNMLNF